MKSEPQAVPTKPSVLACDEALRVTRLEAQKVYRDLSGYRISMTLEPDGWHVDYELKDPNLNGGGPHFVIDGTTGRIVIKRYEQ